MATVEALKEDVDNGISALSQSIDDFKMDITCQLDTFKSALDHRDAAGIYDLENITTKSISNLETKLNDPKRTLNQYIQNVEVNVLEKVNAFQQIFNEDLLKIREVPVLVELYGGSQT